MSTTKKHIKTLGEKIRELRDEKDLSLRELAKKIGISAAFLSDIELGRRYPSDKILLRIAEELGISKEDLRSYDTRPPIDDIKRLASTDPRYALAFRRVVDKKISSKKLLELLDKINKKS